jgi:hypothetical protein
MAGPSVRAGAHALARAHERPGSIVAVVDSLEPQVLRFAIAYDGEVGSLLVRLPAGVQADPERSHRDWADDVERPLAAMDGDGSVTARWAELVAEQPAEIALRLDPAT